MNLKGLAFLMAIEMALLCGIASAQRSGFDDLIGEGVVDRFEMVDPELSKESDSVVVYRIDYTHWRPAEANDTVVIYNHGLQSHRGWFSPTARFLAGEGYTVYAFDRIGSGTSSDGVQYRKKNLVEARGHIRTFDLFLDTLEQMVALVAKQHPGSRIVLWGNSYGGKIVTAYLFDRADELARQGVVAAILTTPGNYRNEKTMPLPFSRARLLVADDMARYPVPMVEVANDNGAAWFVGPGEWFDRIARDELSLRSVTRRFYLETRSLDRSNDRQPKGARFPVPLFVVMVRNDRLMDNEAMRDFVEDHAGEGTFYKQYAGGPGAKHFVLFTEDGDLARADIALFLAGDANEIEGVQAPD